MKHVIPLNSTQQYHDLMVSEKPSVLYFSTPHCSVCHAMLPKVLQALDPYPIDVVQIDAETYPDLAGQARIFVAPTVLVIYEGKEVLRESRFIDLDKITRLIDLIQGA